MRGGPFFDTDKDARPPTRKMSASSLEDFSSRALEEPDPRCQPRPRLKRADTWAPAPGAKPNLPKLQLPGIGTGRPRPKTATATETSEKDTAKLLEEVQAMQAALKQEEDQVLRLREALSEKDTNASSSDNKEGFPAPKAKKKGGILPSWMRNIIDKANQLMKPAATEFFPDKPYSQQRFIVETVENPGTAGAAGGQIRRSSFVRRNSFRASSSGRLTKSRTIGNLESLDHSVSQASLSSDPKERRRNSSVPAHLARLQNSMDSEDPRSSRAGDSSPKDTGRRTRKTRRNSEVRPF